MVRTTHINTSTRAKSRRCESSRAAPVCVHNPKSSVARRCSRVHDSRAVGTPCRVVATIDRQLGELTRWENQFPNLCILQGRLFHKQHRIPRWTENGEVALLRRDERIEFSHRQRRIVHGIKSINGRQRVENYDLFAVGMP